MGRYLFDVCPIKKITEDKSATKDDRNGSNPRQTKNPTENSPNCGGRGKNTPSDNNRSDCDCYYSCRIRKRPAYALIPYDGNYQQ